MGVLHGKDGFCECRRLANSDRHRCKKWQWHARGARWPATAKKSVECSRGKFRTFPFHSFASTQRSIGAGGGGARLLQGRRTSIAATTKCSAANRSSPLVAQTSMATSAAIKGRRTSGSAGPGAVVREPVALGTGCVASVEGPRVPRVRRMCGTVTTRLACGAHPVDAITPARQSVAANGRSTRLFSVGDRVAMALVQLQGVGSGVSPLNATAQIGPCVASTG
mmetsp:Transcript_115026/g.325049  ORF Transcript_115026/g.325049 Transcript_115026/m.325049 type:complete len:223 (+) Transcript_115026:443-1111(+)